MKCAKCGTPNPDDAAFCSFCYESFKAKAPAKAPTLLFPEVTAEFGYWETFGPWLVTRERLFFFVQRCTDITERKTLKGQVHKAISDQGLLGLAVGMAMSPLFEEKRPLKPEEVHIKFVHWEKEPLLAFADMKPGVGSVDELFEIEMKDLKAIKVDPLRRFHFTTPKAEIITSSIEDRDLLTGFLRSSGWGALIAAG